MKTVTEEKKGRKKKHMAVSPQVVDTDRGNTWGKYTSKQLSTIEYPPRTSAKRQKRKSWRKRETSSNAGEKKDLFQQKCSLR